MKKISPARAVLYLLCAMSCTRALATQVGNATHALPAARELAATEAMQGSIVKVPPLMSQGGTVRLPSQAGKVSSVVTTSLMANSTSWIAQGDKYYSLCVPNRSMVACAPIVATSLMEHITVGARTSAKGEPLITADLQACRAGDHRMRQNAPRGR